MAIFKRGNVFWCEFLYAGKRYRESTKTSRKTLAVEYEKRRKRELEETYTSGRVAEEPAKRLQTVTDALRSYAERYAVNHRPKAVAWVKERAAHVQRLLGRAILPDLTEDRVIGYMKARLAEGAGNRTVNMELECLARAFGRTWRELWPKAARLEEPKDTGRALSAEEEIAVLSAATRNRSPLIQPIVRIALLTGCRSDEMRVLQWEQVDLEKRVLTVGKAKTDAGTGRQIPMNGDLYAVLSAHASWFAGKFGEIRPDWYLFPFSSRVKPVDPARPVTTFKTAWESIRAKAKLDCRFHDLRHTVATKMAEAGTPESTMLALLGHMSRAMLERYSHIRMKAKRAAVEAVRLPQPASEVGVPTKVPTVPKPQAIN